MKIKKDRVDYYISFAVFIQSFLIILQQAMISILGMDAEATTIYRVLSSAGFMSLAILFSFLRNKKIFIFTYSVAFLIIILNMIFFPENEVYLKREAFRFLLPMVISSALCLMTVQSIAIVEKALYHVSWLTFGAVLVYALFYLRGAFIIDSYNMGFSYGCLLPMVSLYRHKSKLSLLAVLFLFLIVVAIGSRGAVMVFLAYVLYDVFSINIKLFLLLFFTTMIAIGFINPLVEWLMSLGINSRTLVLLMEGEAFQDSGRGDIYNLVASALDENLLGLGLFADRTLLNGVYSHNMILEMLVNWGIIPMMFFFSIALVQIILLFLKSNKCNKNRLVCYTLVLIGPLMASGSYLIDPNFGIYCGIFYLMSKNNKLERVYNLKCEF